MFARERIKKAHKGRETRGVLIESTEHTIGSSNWSILGHFLGSSALFFFPVLVGFLTIFASVYRLSLPWSSVIVVAEQALIAPHFLGLACSFYAYWTLFCLYILYRGRSHAFNIMKYQTFRTPWKYRRDHVSHMRLDRFRRACQTNPTPGGSPKTETPPDPFTVFINTAKTGTIAITVTPITTVWDLREAICHRGYTACRDQGPIYLLGLWRPLRIWETMAELGVDRTRHFILPPRLRGGADADVNDEDIDLEPNLGVDSEPEPSTSTKGRPKRNKDQRMKEAMVADNETTSDEDKRPKKRKVKPRGQKTNGKGKQRETASDVEDLDYSGDDFDENESDSDAGAKISHEEVADSLPTKTVPEGAARRPKAKAPPRKRKKTNPSSVPEQPAPNAESSSNTTQPNPPAAKKPRAPKVRAPIFHFFENITGTNHGEEAEDGDKFYRCRHGESTKVLKITRLMRGTQNGLSFDVLTALLTRLSRFDPTSQDSRVKHV
ncbi:hypothetical protein C8J57DRAFT_1567271 [Mycena rebaudengoi]|nr:hypothetical protein C8J57DRAFT_1567271 [Mycena rebaudengoi]